LAIKTILVSQPEPENENSPYYDLAEKHDLKIDFRPFIKVEGVNASEFRGQRINLADYSGVLLTSKTAADHFFRIARETRHEVPDSLKYFCISETVALYLQKYVAYRKRKIFFGKQRIHDMMDILKKHKSEKILLPCTDILRDVIPNTLDEHNVKYTKAVLYRTVAADLSDLEDVFYDVLVFFSPGGIESLFKNFPEFKQNKTLIAAFGATTATAAIKNGLEPNIRAPHPKAPSMVGAIDFFLKDKLK
jgi:uroporphyrinogen-III synthase|tara:strand:+ start:23050 stop:23793 length:744 start_codon:yes stop_codon:yes gene_type:complete